MAYSQGSGTAIDPYVIATESELIDIRNYSGSHFILQSDIALTANWVPIPSWHGSINGARHKITNFNSSSSGHTGFIAFNSGPLVIKELELYGGSTGITGQNDYTYSAYILAVTSTTPAHTVLIENCLVVGPFPGFFRGKGAGVVGVVQAGNNVIVRDVVAKIIREMAVSGNGILYQLNGPVDAAGSYFDITLWPTDPGYVWGGEVGLTSAQFTSQSNFPGLDFNDVWQHLGGAYPTLAPLAPSALLDVSGSGGVVAGGQATIDNFLSQPMIDVLSSGGAISGGTSTVEQFCGTMSAGSSVYTINYILFSDITNTIDIHNYPEFDWNENLPYFYICIDSIYGVFTNNLPIDIVHWGVTGSTPVDSLEAWKRCVDILVHL